MNSVVDDRKHIARVGDYVDIKTDNLLEYLKNYDVVKTSYLGEIKNIYYGVFGTDYRIFVFDLRKYVYLHDCDFDVIEG